MMTYEQFEEIVTEAASEHISQDPSLHEEDQSWERENLARKLSHHLRINGFNVPSAPPKSWREL